MLKYIKRGVCIIVLFLMMIVIVGCEGSQIQSIIENKSEEDIVIDVISEISIQFAEGDTLESVTNNLTLFEGTINNCSVSWESSNEAVIAKNGTVTRTNKDETVKLTLTVVLNEEKLTKSFTVVVKAKGTEVPTGESTIAQVLALTLAVGESTTETYTVRGEISRITSVQYGDIYITDGTNEILIYGMFDANGVGYASMENQPDVGDTIVITGIVKNYNGTIEFENATLVEIVKGSTPIIDPDEPQIIDSTIDEVLGLTIASGETTTDYYKVTGVITSVTNTEFGNFYITDGTKTLLIYGLFDENGTQYNELESKPNEGDTIILYGAVKNYKNTLEIVNAILVSFEEGQPLEITSKTIAEVNAIEAGTLVKTSGTIIALYERGFLVKDDTGIILVYMNTTSFTYVVGDIVTLQGAVISYHNHNQFDNTVSINKTGTEEVTAPTAVVLDAAGIDAEIANPTIGKFVEISGEFIIDGTYYNMTVAGTNNIISITYPLTSLGMEAMNESKVKIQGYILDISTDGTRLNIMVTSAEVTGETTSQELPITGDFVTTTKSSTALPKGWRWGQMCKDGSYATFWQSFRSNGDSVISNKFTETDGVTVSFTYYLNNYKKGGSSKIKVTAFDSNGTVVSTAISEEINEDKTGATNAKTLTFALTGEKITSIQVEFVKASGGNVAFSTIKIEKTSISE